MLKNELEKDFRDARELFFGGTSITYAGAEISVLATPISAAAPLGVGGRNVNLSLSIRALRANFPAVPRPGEIVLCDGKRFCVEAVIDREQSPVFSMQLSEI